MAYEVIMLYHFHMPLYVLEIFTEYLYFTVPLSITVNRHLRIIRIILKRHNISI